MTVSHSPAPHDRRKRIARFAVFLLLVLLACTLLLVVRRDDFQPLLANWTGEEDTGAQLKALYYLAGSKLTPAPDTADFAPMRYTDLPPFGINTFFEQEVQPDKIRESMQLIHDAGFHFIRQEFPWEAIEQPAKGQYWDSKYNHSRWQQYDLIVSLAQEYGLEIVARLDAPPDWTRHDGAARGHFAPPDNYNDYGDFVATVAARYKGQIKFYQLWNEPNTDAEWSAGSVNAADYVRLLKVGYTRIKAVDPQAVVISASLAPTKEETGHNLSDLIYLQQMYDAGVRGYFDIMAVQDYGLFWGPGNRLLMTDRPNFSRPILIRGIMVKNGDADKPIWAMEMGWNTQPASWPTAPYGRVTDELQARYTVEAYQRAQQEWPWMGAMMFWFFKRADTHEQDQSFYYFRMFDPDFTAHPVYYALKSYIPNSRFIGLGFHQADDWALDYAGAWEHRTDGNVPAGSYMVGQPGDTATFSFSGTDLALALLNPYGGIAAVSIDGGPAREADLRATDPEANGQVALVQGLMPGMHRAQITVKQGEVFLDGFIVRQTNDWLASILVWPAGLLLVVLAFVVRARLIARRQRILRQELRARLRL